jgi:hypothetical protein
MRVPTPGQPGHPKPVVEKFKISAIPIGPKPSPVLISILEITAIVKVGDEKNRNPFRKEALIYSGGMVIFHEKSLKSG